jgi:hypothetical protein
MIDNESSVVIHLLYFSSLPSDFRLPLEKGSLSSSDNGIRESRLSSRDQEILCGESRKTIKTHTRTIQFFGLEKSFCLIFITRIDIFDG